MHSKITCQHIHLQKSLHHATPLHYAVQVGAKQTVKLLIKYNVDVNVADNVRVYLYTILFLFIKMFLNYTYCL